MAEAALTETMSGMACHHAWTEDEGRVYKILQHIWFPMMTSS
jgi:hypothetical protein